MPVKRRISKARADAISDEALRIFAEMRDLPCTCSAASKARYLDDCPGCRRWWELHPLLRRSLGEKMWRYPTISRHAPDRRVAWPDNSEEARWLRLEAAAEARRQRATVTEPTAA